MILIKLKIFISYIFKIEILKKKTKLGRGFGLESESFQLELSSTAVHCVQVEKNDDIENSLLHVSMNPGSLNFQR